MKDLIWEKRLLLLIFFVILMIICEISLVSVKRKLLINMIFISISFRESTQYHDCFSDFFWILNFLSNIANQWRIIFDSNELKDLWYFRMRHFSYKILIFISIQNISYLLKSLISSYKKNPISWYDFERKMINLRFFLISWNPETRK